MVKDELPWQLKVARKGRKLGRNMGDWAKEGDPAFPECLLCTRSFTIVTYLVLNSALPGEYHFIFILIFRNGTLRYQWSIFRHSENSNQVWITMTILHHPRQGRTRAFQYMERQEELGGGAGLGVAVKTPVTPCWGHFRHSAAVGDSCHTRRCS